MWSTQNIRTTSVEIRHGISIFLAYCCLFSALSRVFSPFIFLFSSATLHLFLPVPFFFSILSCTFPLARLQHNPVFFGSLNIRNTESLTWANVFDIGPTQKYCLFYISFAKETYHLIDQNIESLTWGQCLWHWPHVRMLSLLLGSFEKET